MRAGQRDGAQGLDLAAALAAVREAPRLFGVSVTSTRLLRG